MDKLWQIFPGKGSKRKKKKATKLDPFWLKSGLGVSGSKAKLESPVERCLSCSGRLSARPKGRGHVSE